MSIERSEVVNVYLSYDAKDAYPAAIVREQLRACGNGRFSFASSGELIESADFDGEIEKVLRKTDWFVLILTEPSDTWDWCLYEAGMYGAHKRAHNRMICLHAPDIKPPKSIRDIESIQLSLDDVKVFLKDVCHRPPLNEIAPLNPQLGCESEKLSAMAAEICGAVGPQPHVAVGYSNGRLPN